MKSFIVPKRNIPNSFWLRQSSCCLFLKRAGVGVPSDMAICKAAGTATEMGNEIESFSFKS